MVGPRRAQADLASITDRDVLIAEIEERCVSAGSSVLRAQLNAIMEGDIPRNARRPTASEIRDLTEKALELQKAFRLITSFGERLTKWCEESYKPRIREKISHTAKESYLYAHQLSDAAYRCDVDLDRVPIAWAENRWPCFDADLIAVIDKWARPVKRDARKDLKRDPNETTLIQLLAVVLTAAGAKIPEMKSGGHRTWFQKVCYAVLTEAGHNYRPYGGQPTILRPETKQAFYERVLRVLGDKPQRARIKAVARLAMTQSEELDYVERDLSTYWHMLSG